MSSQLPKRRSSLVYNLHGVISWFPHLKSDTGTVKSFLSYLNWNPCCPSSRPRIGCISSALFLSKDSLVLFCPGPTFKSPAMAFTSSKKPSLAYWEVSLFELPMLVQYQKRPYNSMLLGVSSMLLALCLTLWRIYMEFSWFLDLMKFTKFWNQDCISSLPWDL